MRWFAAAMACVVVTGGCAQLHPGKPPPRDAIAAPAPGGTLCVQGWLTSKGPDIERYWAITDDGGAVWRLVGVDLLGADWTVRHANQRVALEGNSVPAIPLKGLRVRAIKQAGCSPTSRP